MLRGRGHPAVRASHAKTLELTPEADLGLGGTCVVGVATITSGGPIAGALDGELTVAGMTVTFTALGNPGWDPTGAAVVRRSAVRKPDTVATHATVSAADLSADVVAALRDPLNEVTLRLRHAIPQPTQLVLAPMGNADPAEWAAADLVTVTPAPTILGRVLVIGSISAAALEAAPQPIEVVGVEGAQAVAAASPYGADAVLAPSLPDDRDQAVVLRVGVADVEKTLRNAQRKGRRTGAIAGRLPWVHWGQLDTLPVPTGVRTVWICLDPAPHIDVDERIASLRAEGLSVKQIAKQLSAELGIPANQLYARATGSA